MPGICRTAFHRNATGGEIKFRLWIREDNETISKYEVNAVTIGTPNETVINSAIDSWMTSHYGATWAEDGLNMGVHVNRDDTFEIWTGAPPDEWFEDIVQGS